MTTQTDFSSFRFVREFLQRILPNSQIVSLATILLFGSLLIYLLAGLLTPVFASVILAYLLEGLVAKAEYRSLPRLVAVYVVFFCLFDRFGICIVYSYTYGIGTNGAVGTAYT